MHHSEGDWNNAILQLHTPSAHARTCTHQLTLLLAVVSVGANRGNKPNGENGMGMTADCTLAAPAVFDFALGAAVGTKAPNGGIMGMNGDMSGMMGAGAPAWQEQGTIHIVVGCHFRLPFNALKTSAVHAQQRPPHQSCA